MENEKYTYQYPHPAVTTDCIVFGFDGKRIKVLLIRRGLEPYKGRWAFPGGFMRIDESAEQCAERELAEETQLQLTHIKQLGAFSDVNRDPRERVVSIAFYALAKKSEVLGGSDAEEALWFDLDDVPQLAFDHDYMLRKAIAKLREDIHFSPIGFDLLDDEFSMTELQNLYEAILGIRFDRRNFYKKMMQTGILEEADDDALYGVALSECVPNEHMKMKDIEQLFSPNPVERFSLTEGSREAKSHPGRKAKKFRFNKERYDEMKENDEFKLEF